MFTVALVVFVISAGLLLGSFAVWGLLLESVLPPIVPERDWLGLGKELAAAQHPAVWPESPSVAAAGSAPAEATLTHG